MTFLFKLLNVLAKLTGLYSTLIVVRIMLTWIPGLRQPYPHEDGPVVSFFKKICDPYLNLFKSKKTQIGMIDFSPLLALMTLNILQSIFSMTATYGQITIGIIAALIIDGLWHYLFSYLYIIFLILLAVRWFVGRDRYSQKSTAFINSVEPVLYKPVHLIYNIFYKGKNTDDQTIVLTAFIVYLVLYFAVRSGLDYLIRFLCTL